MRKMKLSTNFVKDYIDIPEDINVKQLAEDMIKFVSPFTERIEELKADNEYLEKVVKIGAEKARESARKTIKEVREIIGFKSSL